MATSGDIRLGVDKLVRSITLYGEYVIDAAVDAAELAGEAGARTIATIIRQDTTPTGRARSGAGGGVAGRIATGAMYDSIYDDDFSEATGSAHNTVTRGGNIQFKFGFINSPDYSKYQEEGTLTIDGMHSLNVAFSVAREVFFDELAKGLREAGNAAGADRAMRRSSKLGSRGL